MRVIRSVDGAKNSASVSVCSLLNTQRYPECSIMKWLFFPFFFFFNLKKLHKQKNSKAVRGMEKELWELSLFFPSENSFKWILFPSRCKSRIRTPKGNRSIYGKANTGTRSNGYKTARNKSMLQNIINKISNWKNSKVLKDIPIRSHKSQNLTSFKRVPDWFLKQPDIIAGWLDFRY